MGSEINMKTKLDFSGPLISRTGQPIKEANRIADQLAVYLEAATKGPGRKMWDWCRDLANGGVLELDATDVRTLRQFVDADDSRIPILVRGQVLEILDQSKEG